jgi:zinc transport system permease protein
MVEFWQILFGQGFMRNAVLAGLLASLACGVVGSYVVVRRIVFISGGIAHAVLGGMGIAYYYGFHPLNGALVAALVAAVIIGIASLRVSQREDTVIGAIWVLGMAIGILFISRTPGYNVDLMSYLFGNILMVLPRDLYLTAVLDTAILVLVAMFHKQFLAVCFDQDYARLQGIRVDFFYLLLLCLVAVTVVVLIPVVGIILVIALLTLPAAIAGQYVQGLIGMMIAATGLSAVLTTAGLAVSYHADLPGGATIILLCGGVYLISTLVRKMKRRAKDECGISDE